jgi:hypothetical protein
VASCWGSKAGDTGGCAAVDGTWGAVGVLAAAAATAKQMLFQTGRHAAMHLRHLRSTDRKLTLSGHGCCTMFLVVCGCVFRLHREASSCEHEA